MLDLEKLEHILKEHPPYRQRQAKEAVFRHLDSSWKEATALPKDLREVLERECPLVIDSALTEAADRKTLKGAIRLADDETIETVLMRHRGDRNTVCVSTQAGCGLACDFCLTGDRGFVRNLTAGEIAGQVVLFARYLKPADQRVNNVVFMGMGEPFLNYDAVLAAIRILNNRDGLNIGARKISISTVGVVEGIDRLAGGTLQVNLSLSLHAPDDALRGRLMPINKTYPIGDILRATARYIDRTGRRVMIEYLLLGGVNDSPDDAQKLASLLKRHLDRLFFVNLIAYNPTGKYSPSPARAAGEFARALERDGIRATRRYRFGREIKAACGQLAGEGKQHPGEDGA
ncbi:MAG: 23S rRNA (adenine(2503)-C(2))-methyltransferase RlmN [PVC group bacterium]